MQTDFKARRRYEIGLLTYLLVSYLGANLGLKIAFTVI
jgi:hypothetical protein